jgi:flap endonuclease-1
LGVRGLNTLIKNTTNDTIVKRNLKNYCGKTIVIDTHFFIYKFLMNNGNHIDGLFMMIIKMLNYGIIPIFVFDGVSTDLKEETLEERREEKKQLNETINDLKQKLVENRESMTKEEIEKMEKELKETEGKLVYINRKIISSSKKLMELMGVRYIEAKGEAEIVCSKMSKYELVDFVLTDDTDAIPFGSRRILRELNIFSGDVLEYNINKIMMQWRISLKKIIELSILLGNDYNERPRGIYPDYALECVKKGKIIETISWIKLMEEDKDRIRKVREYYSKDDREYIMGLMGKMEEKRIDLIELRRWLGENSGIESKEYNWWINRVYFKLIEKDSISIL